MTEEFSTFDVRATCVRAIEKGQDNIIKQHLPHLDEDEAKELLLMCAQTAQGASCSVVLAQDLYPSVSMRLRRCQDVFEEAIKQENTDFFLAWIDDIKSVPSPINSYVSRLILKASQRHAVKVYKVLLPHLSKSDYPTVLFDLITQQQEFVKQHGDVMSLLVDYFDDAMFKNVTGTDFFISIKNHFTIEEENLYVGLDQWMALLPPKHFQESFKSYKNAGLSSAAMPLIEARQSKMDLEAHVGQPDDRPPATSRRM